MGGQPTIILVHGAWHGHWCWDDVADALRAQGFDTLAIDLPGHEVPGRSSRMWHSLGSYVDHLSAVVSSVDGEVVVVGHSMGGLVTQRLLERRSIAGAVLVASVPRRGVLAALLRLTKTDPKQVAEALGTVSLWPMVDRDDRVRQHFFSDATDDAVVAETAGQLQNESFRAFLSMILRVPQPNATNSPVLVVAAEQDAIFTVDEQRDLADAYGADLEIVDCGHDIMLEPQWPTLVRHIGEFAASVGATVD